MGVNKLRAERKKDNKCVQCGADLDRKGITCKRCTGMNNISKIKFRNALHEQGLCINCGTSLNREGVLCEACTKKSNTKARERTAERKAKGLCIQCGKIAEDGKSYCQRCLDMRMDRYWKKKIKDEFGLF